jgi:transposase
MKTLDLCHLLLSTDQYKIKKIQVSDWKIRLVIESTAYQAACPECQQLSVQLHSRYWRYPSDLAWADFPVVWNLKAKRFFCRNQACPKRTFAEQHPEILAPYARRTKRLNERQQLVGVNLCARAAENLLRAFHIGISDTTINRLIRALPEIAPLAVRVLGVDDWAKRKGQRYGTLLIDLEKSRVLDVLEDRSTETLCQWLAQHPEIEIISRDRSQAYANAIDQGAPSAIQVADRWHLLKNCTDTVIKILQREYKTLKDEFKKLQTREKITREASQIDQLPDADTADPLTPSEQRRQERIATSLELNRRGMSQKAIAQSLGLHPKTIRRYLLNPDPRNRRKKRTRLLDPYKSYIQKRWKEGCHNASQIFREIKKMGYPGETTIVRDFVKRLRQTDHRAGSGSTPRLPGPRTMAWLLLKPPTDQSSEQNQIWEQVISKNSKLMTTSKLATDFSTMIKDRDSELLDDWLEQAGQSGDRLWRNFAAGLKQDYAAVQAALLLPWSNGPTEGHINRLKIIKRQMYGRAMDDLLRKRALWQGRWSFT